MGKNIVILNGSPRKNGNTAALIDAFTKGAESSGNTVTTFFLDGMDIHGCKGCFGGKSEREYPCVQHDDMAKIYPAVREAEVIVLATPLYYWNMSGQLLTAIDRLFALEEGGNNTLRGHGRGSVLLVVAGQFGYDELVRYFGRMCENLSWENLGYVLAGGVRDLRNGGQDKLDEAYKLGASI